MRRAVTVAALAAGLAAGCSGGDGGPTDFAVTTPPPSATAGLPAATASASGPSASGPSASGPSASGPSASGPGASSTADPGTAAPGTVGPGPTGPGPGGPGSTVAPGGPLQTYLALSGSWATARGAFFAAVSDGRRRTVAQQRALAAAFLTEQKAFGAAVRAADWPARARPTVTALLTRNAGQERTSAAMAAAGSTAGFTARLADYGTATAAENAAVRAVTTALR